MRRLRVGRDLVIAVALKGALLLGIYMLFFATADRPPSDAATTAAALLGTTATKEAR